MAVASRKVRSIRRIKNKARLQRKQARQAVEYIAGQANLARQQLQQAEYTLLTVLAQAGNVIITKGTIENVAGALRNGLLRYDVKPYPEGTEQDKATEFLVSLVEKQPPQQEETKPALTITKVEEPEDAGSGENDIAGDILRPEQVEELVQQATGAADAQ